MKRASKNASPAFKKRKRARNQNPPPRSLQKALLEAEKSIHTLSQETEKSLDMIRELQNRFVPLTAPGAPYFQFSGKSSGAEAGVSGDFFDLFALKDKMRLGLLLASWDSYSLASLFLTSFLKPSSHLREKIRAKDFLSQLLKEISSHLSQKIKPHIFYAVIHRRDLTLDCASIGSVSAWLKPSKGKPVSLGPKNGAKTASKNLPLSTGDMILICSPGAMQRCNRRGEIFGSKRILNILKQTQEENVLALRQEILFQAECFANGHPSQKDQTALALKIQDRVLKLAG